MGCVCDLAVHRVAAVTYDRRAGDESEFVFGDRQCNALAGVESHPVNSRDATSVVYRG